MLLDQTKHRRKTSRSPASLHRTPPAAISAPSFFHHCYTGISHHHLTTDLGTRLNQSSMPLLTPQCSHVYPHQRVTFPIPPFYPRQPPRPAIRRAAEQAKRPPAPPYAGRKIASTNPRTALLKSMTMCAICSFLLLFRSH